MQKIGMASFDRFQAENLMSLVDYASSEEEECDNITEERDKDEKIEKGERGGGEEEGEKKMAHSAALLSPPDRQNRNFVSSSHQSCNVVSPLPLPQMEKLPDASLLFSSSFSSHQSIVTNHSSRIASAIAASDRESRKRESNGSGLAYQHRKLPRGPLPHSRNIPDTVGGQLIPPQLRGRSNVVTEDISKLFVRKDG